MAYLLDRYFSSRFVPFPSMLTVEITSYCNLRCVMCPKTAGFVNTPPDRMMDWETFEKLESVLPYVSVVDLSGLWGEAFIRPGLYLRMLRRLKEHGIHVRTISNGNLITPDLARDLTRLGLDILTISVDAARPETYRKIRPGGELERVLEGVRHVQDEKGKQGRPKPEIEFMFLGMVDNIAEFPDFVRTAEGLGVTKIGLQAMGEFDAVRGKSLAWGNRELGRMWYEKAKPVAEALGVEIALIPPDQFEPPLEKETHKEAEGGRRSALRKDCFQPWDRAIVATNGDVLPCCASPKPMGNLSERSFEEIWRSTPYRKLRRGLRSTEPPKMCVTCTGLGWSEKNLKKDLRLALSLLSISTRRTARRVPFLRRLKALLTHSS